ncbi:MAG: hypothetical protein ACRD68_02015 [Pyrinomonadaceae bacterium]
MRSRFNIGSERRRRLTRAVVIFFLLHAGADLAFPQYFCREDFGGIIAAANSTDSTKPAQKEQLAASFDGSDGIPSETPSEQLPHEEDCFCCCAHVLPSADLSRIKINELNSTQPAVRSDSIPSPPVREMYRPPRLA